MTDNHPTPTLETKDHVHTDGADRTVQASTSQGPSQGPEGQSTSSDSATGDTASVAVSDAAQPAADASFAIPEEELERLTADIVAALKSVYDPEIPADIYELGLIYNIDIDKDRLVTIEMTLTSPGCPVAGEMPAWVENAVSAVPGVNHCVVRLTFDPPWEQSRMSDEARLALNMF